MKQRNASKQTTGVKALIAAASVAATVAGWALLPANDPGAAAATEQPNTQTGLGSSRTVDDGQLQRDPNQLPGFNTPSQQSSGSGNNTLPWPSSPQGSSGFGMPFTRSHSSR